MRGDVKKFAVFVRDRSTNRVKNCKFGSKTMTIKKIYQLGNDILC